VINTVDSVLDDSVLLHTEIYIVSQKGIVSDIAEFVLKRDVKLQPTNQKGSHYIFACNFAIC